MDPLAPVGEKEKKPVIVLRAGELECVITKGQPKRAGEKVTDTLNLAGATLGLKTRGNQPDVVLTFSRAGSKESITVLGDAKRNEQHDGKGYLRVSLELAAVYAVSYREAMKLRFSDRPEVAFEGPVLPAMTLLMLQMPSHQGLATEELVRRFRADTHAQSELPAKTHWLAGLALDQHFPPGGPSPVLAAWIGHLGRQAQRHLCGLPGSS